MPSVPPPAPLLGAPAEVVAVRVWAARVHDAAMQFAGIAHALGRAGRDVGLQGPAGTALQHLVGGLGAEVHGLATACDAAATTLLARSR